MRMLKSLYKWLIQMSKYYIQSYKHDGSLHRTWSKVNLISEDEDKFVSINKRTQIIEANKRTWIAREPAIYYLYKNAYYNVIAMLREDGIYYYCNLASPSLYDGEAIKNIDYDLDVKFHPNGSYQILDEKEFKVNKEKFNYPKVLEKRLRDEIDMIVDLFKNNKTPFNKEENSALFQQYLKNM